MTLLPLDWRAVAMALVIASGVLTVQHIRGRDVGIRDGDEIAWVLTAPYFGMLTDRDDPRWLGREALNHPPFAKILMGLVIDRAHWPADLSAKEAWLDDQWNMPRAADVFRRDAALVHPEALARGRQLSLVAMLLALAFTTLCALEAFGAGAAVVAALWLGTSPLSTYLARLAVSDAVLIAALAACAFLTLRLRREQQPRRALLLAVALGVCAACAGQTKLNGVVALPLAAVMLVPGRLKHAVRDVAVAGVVCLLVSVALNPALTTDPVAWLRGSLAQRLEYVGLQKRIFIMEGFPLFEIRVATFIRELGYHTDLVYMLNPLDVALLPIAVLAFLLRLGRDGVRPNAPQFGVMFLATAWVALSFYGFPMAWPRYVAPAAMFLAPLVGAGITALPALVRDRPGKVRVALAVLAVGAFPLVSARLTTANYFEANPAALAAASVERARALLEQYPEDPAVIEFAKASGVTR